MIRFIEYIERHRLSLFMVFFYSVLGYIISLLV